MNIKTTILLFIFNGIAILGCMKAPSMAIDKGPVAACDSIDTAIAGIQHPSVNRILPQEMASVDTYTMVDSPFRDVTQTQDILVTQPFAPDPNNPGYQDIYVTITYTEKVGAGYKKYGTGGPLAFPMGSTSAILQARTRSALQAQRAQPSHLLHEPPLVSARDSSPNGLPVPKGDPVAFISRFSSLSFLSKISSTQPTTAATDGTFCQAQSEGTVNSYHNLSIVNSNMEIPSAVALQTGCGGLANCAAPINTQVLTFDRWIDDPNQPGQEMKVTSYIVSSSDVPFFASVLSQCEQYSWPYYGTGSGAGSDSESSTARFVLITTCSDVTNFSFGTAAH